MDKQTVVCSYNSKHLIIKRNAGVPAVTQRLGHGFDALWAQRVKDLAIPHRLQLWLGFDLSSRNCICCGVAEKERGREEERKERWVPYKENYQLHLSLKETIEKASKCWRYV